jgi:hypothetical protein
MRTYYQKMTALDWNVVQLGALGIIGQWSQGYQCVRNSPIEQQLEALPAQVDCFSPCICRLVITSTPASFNPDAKTMAASPLVVVRLLM